MQFLVFLLISVISPLCYYQTKNYNQYVCVNDRLALNKILSGSSG